MSAWYTEIVRTRIVIQRLAAGKLDRPEAIVAWLGAVQAQDYPGAKWALGQRGSGFTDADVDAAFDAGRILRTHVMRPTWHFVAPADLRWLLKLTGPRVHAANGSWYRRHGLDPHTLAKGRRIFERSLRKGHYLTRQELARALKRGGIEAPGHRLIGMVMHAEVERVICSGPRRGTQFTYALFDERVPPARDLDHDEALAELTRRYFTSHGPATIRDFVWWSGLTVREARMGADMIASELTREIVGEREYLRPHDQPPRVPASRAAYLLPNYDECLIAYKDRGPATGNTSVRDPHPHHLIVDGRLAGSWRRTVTLDHVTLDIAPYHRLPPAETRSLERAAAKLGTFLGLTTRVTTEAPARRSRTKMGQ